MDRNIRKLLTDILKAIDEINMFLEVRPRTFQTLIDDRCFLRAVQMNVAIMGEAMNRVLKLYPDIAITSARKVVNTRNYVIHGYDSLSLDILWNIVVNHLPLLREEVIALLNAEETESSN